MQKIIYILSFLLLSSVGIKAQKDCCPNFEIKTDRKICDNCGPKSPVGYNGEKEDTVACRNGVHQYFVVPGGLAGFTYQWQVIGGDMINSVGVVLANPLTTTQSDITVKWGNGTEGKIIVSISNPDGSCKQTLSYKACLVDGPNALFTVAPSSNVCRNTPVSFTNLSIGGTQYFWDFGDGTTSTLQNPPPHGYSSAGTKIISLTVSKQCSTRYSPPGYPQDVKPDSVSPCSSIYYQTITVSDKEGLSIITDCNKMICVGEKVKYCAGGNCSSLNWQVNGGHIVGGAANKSKPCIEVIWDNPPLTGLPTITLSGNCGGGCGNTATLEVPVLYNNMPISGSVKVCVGSQGTYSLPVMPGVFYNWTITPAMTINGNSINTNAISVDWSSAIEGTSYTIKCDYYNPTSGKGNTVCSGSSSKVVEVKPKLRILGNAQFCTQTGQTFLLGPPATAPQAVWTITPSTGFAPPNTAAASPTLTETWSVGGVYQVKAVLNAASLPNFCTSEATYLVQVNPQPTVAINPALPQCPGTPIMYSATASVPGGNFNWTIPSGGTIMQNYGDAVLVSWSANTAHTITVNYFLNGCSATNSLTIPALSNGTPSGPTDVCMDAESIYQITGGNIPSGGYTWSLGSSSTGGTIQSGQGTNQVQILWHGSSTQPVRTETIIISTCAGPMTYTVTVISSGNITITKTGVLCSTTGATLTATGLPSSTVCNWYLNGVLIPGNTTSLQIFSPGIYKVVPTGAGACYTAATFYVPKEFAGVATIVADGPTVYPCLPPFSLQINSFINSVAATSALYDFTWYSQITPTTNVVVGTNSPFLTVTAPGLYWVKICMKGTQCCDSSNLIHVIKDPCQGPDCTATATANIIKSDCNPYNFSITWNPGTVINTVWSFGDGYFGSGNAVTHNYEYAGTYWINVTGCIQGPKGCCTVSKKMQIVVPFVPKFDTSYNFPDCASVTLTNQTTFVPAINLTYTWSSTGTSTHTTDANHNAVFTYTQSGTYIVTLTVTDGLCTKSYSLPVHIMLPTATISGPSTVCAGTSATFSTSDPIVPNNLSYYWQFGDGFTSMLKPTEHIYAVAPPSETITLTITDERGCKATATKTITILPPLVVNVTYTPDTLICPGSVVVFNVTPATFQTYQWYKDGVAILSANTSSYTTGIPGKYHVAVTSNNGGCEGVSKGYYVFYKQKAIANINTGSVACFNSNTNSAIINLAANMNNWGPFSYHWQTILKPLGSTVTIAGANSQFATATVNAVGIYQFEVTVTNTISLCTAKDSVCVFVSLAPTVSINATNGTCAGPFNFLQTTNYPPVDNGSFYAWNNGTSGQITGAFSSGNYSVIRTDKSNGCSAASNVVTVSPRPSTALFPQGCDTICMNDTAKIMPPLGLKPGQTVAGIYNVNWLDNGFPLLPHPAAPGVPIPIGTLSLGMHHLVGIVTFISGNTTCADTSASYDLFIKNCYDTCGQCKEILKSGSITGNATVTSAGSYQLNSGSITFTILKPVTEVRISLDDVKYRWSDTSCNNCKLTAVERGCLFPANANQPLGTLLWNNYTNTSVPPNAAVNNCNGELVWKNGTMLQPGTYTIPFQLSLPGSLKDKCKLLLDKYCIKLTLIDEDCNRCETSLCQENTNDDPACKCNAGNNWTSLYLVPKKPGIAKPRNQILCGSTLTGYLINTPYVLSGVYHCQGNCASIKNEIVVYNQVNQVIYTRLTAALNETIEFPAYGQYSVTLTAVCGKQKCVCSFRINVKPDGIDPECFDCPVVITDGKPKPPNVDSVLATIIPPDFNGGILVSKNDTIVYEKYVSFKDSVNSHTAFDLASVTKTFTAMAVLKLMEEGKLSVDDAVVKYLPQFPVPEITIKMLLSHKSGLEDYLKFMDESDWDKNKNLTNQDLLQFIAANKSKVLINTPGKVFDYSNTNFALLSLIIEKVSGQLYKDYLATTFFKPLQMNDTYVLGADNYARATKSYYKNGKIYSLRYLDLITGDKCVYSTVQDLKKWDKALRSGKLFKKATLDLAYAPTSPLTPFASNYGLGWKKVVTSNGNEMIYHTGWWAGSRSILIRLPKENTMIAVVSNNNFTNIADIRKLCDLFGDYQQSNKKIANF